MTLMEFSNSAKIPNKIQNNVWHFLKVWLTMNETLQFRFHETRAPFSYGALLVWSAKGYLTFSAASAQHSSFSLHRPLSAPIVRASSLWRHAGKRSRTLCWLNQLSSRVNLSARGGVLSGRSARLSEEQSGICSFQRFKPACWDRTPGL